MITQTCHRCGSTQLRKNGRTNTGHQTFHCTACNFSSTLDTQTTVRAQRKDLAAQLHLERLSQRAVARTLKMSRRTVARVWKKTPDSADWDDDSATARTPRPRV
jgi:transposase-like protein